jgi:hypothetical protein
VNCDLLICQLVDLSTLDLSDSPHPAVSLSYYNYWGMT